MNPKERVLAALEFQLPDRMPIFDQFWPEFVAVWRQAKGLGPDVDIEDYYEIDIAKITPDETPFPSQVGVLEDTGEYAITRDGWGVVQRTRRNAWFCDELGVALADKAQIGRLQFESPYVESRYAPASQVDKVKQRRCAFVKTGGPYLRTSRLRGMAQWLLDLVDDEEFSLELAMKVTDHMTAVGLEAIRRYNLYDTGVWFFDDMAWNHGPMFSPRTFQRVFMPCYARMCEAYRRAGVAHIFLHSDGNIEPILDLLVDVGIMAIHPVEPKAGMDVVRLRQRYGKRLAFIGGLCNARVLPQGTRAEVEAHVQYVLGAGLAGGLVIGSHSIGPDVPVDDYDLAHQLIRQCGINPQS
ncbi:MAG: uroporphyrinogen decarboxylase family protein [Anaerolineae bacterium]